MPLAPDAARSAAPLAPRLALRAGAVALLAALPLAGWLARGGFAGPSDAPAARLPHEDLARLDTRTPTPLTPAEAWQQKQRMMGFLEAIEAIDGALARDDWEGILRASQVLGTTPENRARCRSGPPPSDRMDAMALGFRCRADTIGDAARARDHAGVLRATADTLGTCNGCHQAFRQDVVDAEVRGRDVRPTTSGR